MQVHKITLIVLDHDGVGAEGVASLLENTRYANDAISPTVIATDSVEIGEWEDTNPLNSATFGAAVERLFGYGSTAREFA